MARFFADHVAGRRIPNCGTAACIGGWVIALSHRLKPKIASQAVTHLLIHPANKAKEILQITPIQADRLFLASLWPESFQNPSKFVPFDDAGTPNQNAKLAARRIEHFIRTGGKE